MASNPQPAPVSKVALWIGRVISALAVLMLVMSAVMKLLRPPEVVEGFNKLGWGEDLALTLAILELFCAAIYVIPPTAVLGAILVTGYLGGAIATHVRIYDPSFATALILGVLVWLGLYLREPRLRALIPFRK
jgi:hypothetical protein